MNVQKEIFKNVPRVSSNKTNQVRIHQSVDHVVYLTSHFWKVPLQKTPRFAHQFEWFLKFFNTKCLQNDK